MLSSLSADHMALAQTRSLYADLQLIAYYAIVRSLFHPSYALSELI